MPTSSETRAVNPVLQGFVEAYMNAQQSFLAPQGLVFPILKTSEKTGTYYKWGDESFKGRGNAFPTAGDLQRAYKGDFSDAPPRSMSTGTYSAVEYGERDKVDLRQEKDTQSPVDLRGGLTMALMADLLIAWEKRLTAIVLATATVTQNTTLTGTDQWSDKDNSSPIDKINTAVDTIRIATAGGLGVTHEIHAVTNPTVWNALRFHPELAGAISNNRNQVFGKQDFMEFFGINALHIPDCVANSSNVGQTASGAYIWTDDFLVYAKPKAPGLMTHAFGYMFELQGPEVEERELDERHDRLIVSQMVDEKLVNVKDAYLIKDCLA